MKQYVSLLTSVVVLWLTGGAFATSRVDPVVATTVIPSKWVTTDAPTWFQPSDRTDWSYWESVIPYEVDKGRDSYVVVPKIGLVVPISTPTTEQLQQYKNAKPDLNQLLSYFDNGVFAHPGSSRLWSGNYVVGWHSSNYSTNKGRYNTIFSTLLAKSSVGDSIYVYVNRWWWEYWYYRYEISELLQADPKDPKDLRVLEQTSDPMLTLYTCLPVWSVKYRGVVRAKLVEVKLMTPKYQQYLDILLKWFMKNTDVALSRYQFYRTKLEKQTALRTQLHYLNHEVWTYFVSKLGSYLKENNISLK